jgi:hypothetical protein
MNNNNCFEKLEIGIDKNHPIWDEHLTYDYGHVEIKSYDTNKTFLRTNLPKDYFKNEPIYELMIKYNLTAKIFLIQSQWQYNWHRDAFRKIAFNLLLTDNPEYLTLFAHTYPTNQKTNIENFIYSPTTRLTYEYNKFYLLNSQIPHIAINYSNIDRYVLTIANFEKEPVPTFYGESANFSFYKNIVTELTEQGLIANASSTTNNQY